MLELNVKFVPVFGGRFPVAAVVYKTLHDVSLDSSATVTLVAVVAVPVIVPVSNEIPLEFTRNLSVPPVSIVTISASGNLMAVFASPVWIILSAIDKSAAIEVTPAVTFKPPAITLTPPPTTTIPSLDVMKPTESIFVTSS